MIDLNIQKAIIFATIKHKDQKRKGTDIPYIIHPMEVMQILTTINCRENVIIAGILHDTLEDTDTTPEEIKQLFGEEVLNLVQCESEDKSKTWKERKQTTIDSLKDDSINARLIAFADKLSNIRSIYRDKIENGEKVWERFNADKDSIKWYYSSLNDIFKMIPDDDSFNLNIARDLYKEYDELINAVFD